MSGSCVCRTGLALVALVSSTFAGELSKRKSPPRDFGPDPASVERVDSGYRYPQEGWIVLHIEGDPYPRGFQHGKLLAPEIGDYIRMLSERVSVKDPAGAWRGMRTAVNALFLRKYDAESLEEMKGIADGAAAAGIKIDGRPIDLVDIAVVNSEIELAFLDDALEATAIGLEGKVYPDPLKTARGEKGPSHCSAFAAVGPATADGKVVIGHITMFNLAMVPYFDVWLDVQPSKGRRVFMQTYPGGIQSGMDYYYNDHGLVVCETTIKQTRFAVEGAPLASRIRKALQYSDSIDDVAAILKAGNNGLYTNEWLIADTRTNEIAMFELGTHKSRLWRSSKNEWLGGTEGFYWGCNNAKDLEVRLETIAATDDRPANVVFHPSPRDLKWLELYKANKGKIGVDFGFEAFSTPPLAAYSSCDAKFTSSALVSELKTYALFGPPLGRTWRPTREQIAALPSIKPLYPNDWTLLSAVPPPAASPGGSPVAVDLASAKKPAPAPAAGVVAAMSRLPAWRGTILPAADSDIWLAAAFAEYERVCARERALSAAGAKPAPEALALLRYPAWSRYRTAVTRLGNDVPLALTRSDFHSSDWYEIAEAKGELLLQSLRGKLGDDAFFALMNEFGVKGAGKPAKTSDFIALAEKKHGKPLKEFFASWLEAPGVPAGAGTETFAGAWSIDSFQAEPEKALIIVGTLKNVTALREAGELLREAIRRRWTNVTVEIAADADVSEELLASRHLLLVGGPDSNEIAARLHKSAPLKFGPGSFVVNGKTYAHPRSAVIVAAANPLASRYSMVLYAGLSVEATLCAIERGGIDNRGSTPAEGALILPEGRLQPFVVGR